MNSVAEPGRWPGTLPTGRAVSDAIDIVARLTEEAERLAGQGEKELAMSEALGAVFGYMVAYFHHLTLECREPRDALAKAAAGIPELDAAELVFLHTISAGPAAYAM